MVNSTSRIIIETVVKKTLSDIKDSPERSIRNLVDMALHFSNGRFQHSFFEVAQTMLQNENSPYYGLIEDTVCHVDSERILHFGMNLGYNGCTLGAKVIREIEAKENYNIPWMVTLKLDVWNFYLHLQEYQTTILQGEEIGIYTWMLLPTGTPEKLLSLVREHSDSAFVLFCTPDDITPPFMDSVSEINNLMLVIRYEEATEEVCERLRKAKMLYSVYYCYNDADEKYITEGDLFYSTQQLHPVFTVLLAEPECSDVVREHVYDEVQQARNHQLFQTIAWEFTCDSNLIDSVISSDSCVAVFDSDGYLITSKESNTDGAFNLLRNNLSHILKLAFPKHNTEENMV